MRFNSNNEPYGPIRLNTSLAAPAGKQRNISNFLLSCLVLIVALTSAGVPSLAIAQVPAVPTAKIGVLNYRGFTADVSELNSLPNGAEILAALRRQIDICVEAGLASDKIAFMQSVPLAIRIGAKGDPGNFDGRKVTLNPMIYPYANPILLHELLHAYHRLRLPGGFQNQDILTFYQRARDTPGLFPAHSYMLSNVNEYFAMTASVFLHGSAARDPSTRANLKTKQPVYYQWLEKEFGAR